MALLKFTNGSVLAFLKSTDGSVLALLKSTDGFVLALLRLLSIFACKNSTVGEFWCTIAIMKEKQQNFLFEINHSKDKIVQTFSQSEINHLENSKGKFSKSLSMHSKLMIIKFYPTIALVWVPGIEYNTLLT